MKELDETAQEWLKGLLKRAERDTPSGDIADIPELPKKFNKILNQRLRGALAQGYWLQHVYLQELRAANQGKKYRGKITLSDMPSDDELRGILGDFISGSETWDKVIPQYAVKWLDGYTPKLAGVFSGSVLEKTRDVIRNSMIEGSTLQERMKALRESSAELSSMARHRIEAIARTEITRADTMGRLISMKANDDVIGVEFSAVMDDRTTDICASRHGLVMRLDDPRLPENTPPQHVNCRSILLPVTVYDYPDGLSTSHEFDGIASSKQRPEDIEEVRKILDSNEEPSPSESAHTGAAVVDAGADSMKALQEMATEGKISAKILGTRKEQAQIYHEINRLYERPAYLNRGYIQAEIGKADNGVSIEFHGRGVEGVFRQGMFPSGSKADKDEREGLIKYLLHEALPELELRIYRKCSTLEDAKRLILEILGETISLETLELINNMPV